MLPEGLKNLEAEDNKCLLVLLALRYQGSSLVSGSEREDAAYGQGFLELLLLSTSPVSRSFSPFPLP